MSAAALGEVEGVVLAAGLSRRSGHYKMTLPLGDRTVIERSVLSMYSVASRIVVVVGWRAGQLREVLAGYEKVTLVPNERFRAGMFRSVQVGVAQVRAPAFLLLPGDQPLVSPQAYADILRVQGDVVIPTFRGERGHPVLIQSRLIPEILSQPEDATLRDVIEAVGCVTVEVADEGILLDLDTPEDYAALQVRWAQMATSA